MYKKVRFTKEWKLHPGLEPRTSRLEVEILDERGIRTLASEDTSALNWRLRPLGHLAMDRSRFLGLTKFLLIHDDF
uniref:DUF5641 domain-containing protein n=1 Tax=Strongyloides papillosus TaxID=174720 RepID=A0A0N5CHA8_STREA